MCGTQEGVLGIFSWGDFGDVTDRFPGHTSSIDSIVAIDEDRLVTGCADGLIRLVSVQVGRCACRLCACVLCCVVCVVLCV